MLLGQGKIRQRTEYVRVYVCVVKVYRKFRDEKL